MAFRWHPVAGVLMQFPPRQLSPDEITGVIYRVCILQQSVATTATAFATDEWIVSYWARRYRGEDSESNLARFEV